MERVNVGAALLCRKLKLDCIKLEMGRRPKNIGGRLVYPYSVERDGKAIIMACIPIDERPSRYLNETELMFEEGDCLNGKRLWGCTDKPNKKSQRDVGSSGIRSGRHSRQAAEILGNECYIVIVSSWSGDNIDILPTDYIKHCIGTTMELMKEA